MTKTDETTQTESCNLIVCEILCYVQNKMDNINHDYIVKTVADFYNENDIHTAKTMLFGCCKDTALRFKSYRMDAAKLDCRDIITKMNEIGTECPTFVAKNVSLLPPTTADMFNLTKITNNIKDILKIESTVVESFGIMGCLQKDLDTMLEKFKVIDNLVQSVDAMKLAVDKRSARRIIESESSSSDSDSGDETISDSSSIGDVPNSVGPADLSVKDATDGTDVLNSPLRLRDGPADPSVTDATDGTDVLNSPLRLRDGPANRNAWMTEGGFHMVKSKDRVVVNSNYNVSHPGQDVPKLRAVRPARRDYNSQHGGGRGSGGGSHYNNGRCDIFVSRLQPSTSARDVIINLKSKFNRNFRVEQLQTKYDHYASFKVTVPITFKKDLLNKDNWDDNHVFVKSFVKRPSPRF